MRNKLMLRLAIVISGISLSISLFFPSASAQFADREKPKLKNFGSSLKRIKWDASKNADYAPVSRNNKLAKIRCNYS